MTIKILLVDDHIIVRQGLRKLLEAQKNFLSYSLRLLRENLMLSLGQSKNDLVFLAGEEASFSDNFHPFITAGNIYPLTDEFNLAHAHIESNGNAKIII